MEQKTPLIKFIDIDEQKKRIQSQIEQRIRTVLSHGKFIMGPEVHELEEKLADYVGATHCISCASGTDALLLALMAHKVGPGDAVFTTPFTFVATAEVIALLGATPVFVDIELATFNIDPEQLRHTIISTIDQGKLNPKAIIAVDLFGQPADYDEINQIATEHNLFVVEDAAQSFGATYKGKKAGNLADIAATSFFPAKPLGCFGDGGAVFCNDTTLAEIISSTRIHGKGNHKYDNIRIGLNSRLDTIQAAIILAKFEIFDEEVTLRNEVAKRYLLNLPTQFKRTVTKHDRTNVWAQFSIMHARREYLLTALKEKGIPTAIYYPKPLHLQEAFAYLDYKEGSFPVTEKASKNIFSLPMHPYMSEADQLYITEALARS